ncbi:MAG TPA: hypothetical protein VFG50_11930 [Rhodothermales bacterium]|nr:hypothetical protein [Rhodothermales bacterium]
MPKQNSPKSKSTRSPAKTPDQASPQPSGEEVKTTRGAPKRPPRETGRKQNDVAKEAAGPTPDVAHLQETATEYFNRLSGTAGDLSNQARRMYDGGQSFVRKHPARSLGGAVMLGVVIGLLIGRD